MEARSEGRRSLLRWEVVSLAEPCLLRGREGLAWYNVVSSPDPTHYAGKGLVTFRGGATWSRDVVFNEKCVGVSP